jgi:TolB-like protein/Tfp pilus assembly protein PilF
MRRCPECRRDYYDDSLLYCLDDGTALLEGPASGEPTTAILSSDSVSGEQATRSFGQVPTSGATSFDSQRHTASKKNSLIAGVVGLVLVTALGVGSYLYYGRGSANQIESIAVMPFVNGSGNADVEYLSDGMTETLINSLSKVAGLSVKARNAVFPYKGKEVSAKQIGDELGVQAVLLGRLVERGGNIKLNLELVNAQTLDVIWSEQYDRKQGDLVNLQQEIARDVSSRLRPKLTGTDEQMLAKSYTTDSEAYRLYLQGRFYWNKQTGQEFEKCADYFRRAIEKDPNFALGYVGLADYYGGRERDKAKEHVNRALALDPDLAEANGTLGYQYMLDYDWANAERYMKRALELTDSNVELHRWNGQRLMMLGRFDEAFAAYDRALAIDPNSSATRLSYGACLMASGKLDEAVRYLEDAVKADPTHIWLHPSLAQAYGWKNDWARAVEQRAITRELSGDPEDARMMRESFAKGGRDGFLRDRIKLRESRDAPSGQSQSAEIYAWVGENEKALQILEGAAERKGDFWLFLIKYHPAYDRLRGDPRFQAIVRIFDAR